EKLKEKSIYARVVSMPSWELFEKQDSTYKEMVFPKNIRRRLSVEAGSTLGWLKYTTEDGKSLGLNHFGESAPAEDLFKEFGFTVENIVTLVEYL
ncbi:MAG TPA: transketolase C-terminal domain-containing protein, partial [Puia sp.]